MRRLGGAALALLTLGVGVVRAQTTPPDRPLPPVPDSLPAAVRDSLASQRARTLNRAEAFNARVPDFTTRCGPGRIPAEDTARLNSCSAEFAGLRALSDSVVREKAEFVIRLESAIAAHAPCSAVERQLAQDRMALVRQQRVSELLVSELESWARENADAQAGALKVGLTTLFGGVAKQLQTREASASAFQGVLTRYEREMRTRGIPFDAMRERIERATRGYVSARVQATAGTVMGHAADANDLWNFARTEAGGIAAAQARADADVRVAMSDPAFQRFIQTDATAADLVRATLDQVASTPALEPLTKPYALASFLVDYGYEASKWAASRARILQGAQLSDEQLKAVAALTAQMERTVARLRACRAGGR